MRRPGKGCSRACLAEPPHPRSWDAEPYFDAFALVRLPVLLAGFPALFAAGFRRLRASPREAAPRGMFCLMGACQECLVRVDGEPAQACQEPVRDGMSIAIGAVS